MRSVRIYKIDVFLVHLALVLHFPLSVCDLADKNTVIATVFGAGFPTVAIYDQYNPYQDKIQAMAEYYVAPGETLLKLL